MHSTFSAVHAVFGPPLPVLSFIAYPVTVRALEYV